MRLRSDASLTFIPSYHAVNARKLSAIRLVIEATDNSSRKFLINMSASGWENRFPCRDIGDLRRPYRVPGKGRIFCWYSAKSRRRYAQDPAETGSVRNRSDFGFSGRSRQIYNRPRRPADGQAPYMGRPVHDVPGNQTAAGFAMQRMQKGMNDE